MICSLRIRAQGGRARQRGVVMALVLWMVVVLSIVATSLAFDVRIDSRLALFQREQLQAYNLAKSAVAVGMTHLQNDLLIDFQENPNQPYDAFSDVWAQPWRRDQDEPEQLGAGTYELEIIDEDSKININTANARLLRAMMEFYGLESPESDDIANAIVDWRDADNRVTGSAADLENEFYSQLLGQRIRRDTLESDLIYRCPNEPFLTVEQLLDVCGMTPDLFYGFDPEAREAERLERRNRAAIGRSQRERRARRARREPLPMSEIVTVNGSGRINLNTASEEVLTIILYAAGNLTNMDAAQTAAESIVNFRGGGRGKRAPSPDDAFKSLADLQKVPGMNDASLALLGNSGALGVSVDFKSNVYMIVGTGRAGRAEKTISVIVDKRLETYNPEDARLLGSSGSRERGGFASRRRSGGGRSRRGERNEDNFIRIPAIRVLQWIE
ncbi:MAG: type II secretion system protein GspK [Candidatus Sumerlaeaceae bacterium]|nr:type II secretion system protein GspK [Candidatus Sumerlaeaceae bacterium]